MPHEDLMRVAMEEADIAVNEGNFPCGVVVVDEHGNVVARDHDRVKEQMDPTAHGEINAIRSLCKAMQTTKLPNMTFYTTSEPCPTCLSAMIKARVGMAYYGAKTEEDASLPISAEWLASQSKKFPIEVHGGILADECLAQRESFLGR